MRKSREEYLSDVDNVLVEVREMLDLVRDSGEINELLALQMLLLRLFGYQTTLALASALLPLAALHAVLVLPVYWLMYTVEGRIRPRRVQI